jgi:Protein of unknown function (DUF4235)
MKFLFLPFSIVGGLIAGFISKQLFDALWGLIDDQEPPDSEHREISVGKLVLAAAIEGAVFRAVRKLIDHEARRAFAGTLGTWPGEERPEPE